MNIFEIAKTVFAVIGAVIAAVSAVGGLAAWLGKLWADKLLLRESAKYQRELEEFKNHYTTELEILRSNINERRDLLSNTLSALSSGYTASHEKIVEAMEILWKAVMEIRSFVGPQILLYQLLAPEEYNNLSAEQQKKFITVRRPETVKYFV